MGIFGKRAGAPTKQGNFEIAWPQSSGLGVASQHTVASKQTAYLVYTSARRRKEPIPAEDSVVMAQALDLLKVMANGDPLNEVPLIQGELDIQMWDEPWSARFCANAVVTERRLLLWWKGVRGRSDQMIILGHDFMSPRFDEKGKRVQGTNPYMWFGAIFTPFPPRMPPIGWQSEEFGVRVEAHLGSDAQANRRSMSVRNTLLEVERRVHRGRKI